jgi:uncharacterized protein YegP (UPF0339 family)
VVIGGTGCRPGCPNFGPSGVPCTAVRSTGALQPPSKGGKFRFRLKAGNGEIIAVGEAYETKASAKNGGESVKKNAADATVVDLTE